MSGHIKTRALILRSFDKHFHDLVRSRPTGEPYIRALTFAETLREDHILHERAPHSSDPWALSRVSTDWTLLPATAVTGLGVELFFLESGDQLILFFAQPALSGSLIAPSAYPKMPGALLRALKHDLILLQSWREYLQKASGRQESDDAERWRNEDDK